MQCSTAMGSQTGGANLPPALRGARYLQQACVLARVRLPHYADPEPVRTRGLGEQVADGMARLGVSECGDGHEDAVGCGDRIRWRRQ